MQLTTDLTEDFASLHIDRPAPLPLASLGARLVGHVIDMLLFYASVLAVIRWLEALPDLGPWGWPFFLVVPELNFVLCLGRGQTLGKMVAGTRLVTMYDERVPAWRLLLRYPAGILGLLDVAFVLGSDRRALHDKLAGTRVVTAASSEHVYDARNAP